MQWDETRENLEFTLARNTFGLHMPVRLGMERMIVNQTVSLPRHCLLHHSDRGKQSNMIPSFAGVPRSNLSLDILTGKDEQLDFKDVMPGAWLIFLCEMQNTNRATCRSGTDEGDGQLSRKDGTI